jgi:2-polyprenyl-3-methyl-5-hydroxy-6-metoxy-1,4-benzoquinol methylase
LPSGPGAASGNLAVEAVDCAPSTIEFARKHRKQPGVSYGRACLPELTYASGALDAVTANFVLNHTPIPERV